jgi:outer membrane protein assembly factor BamB
MRRNEEAWFFAAVVLAFASRAAAGSPPRAGENGALDTGGLDTGGLDTGAAGAGAAGNWPHWRGPTGNGVSPDGRPPVEWSESKNVKWKAALPGKGSGSPVVWGKRVFVVAAVEDVKPAPAGEPLAPQRFTLLSLDRATGEVLWERVAAEATPHEGHHEDHGFASASPFTDGERVWAYFGSRGLFAYDLEGKLEWKRTDFGKMETRGTFGEGSSPTLYREVIVVPWDHEGPSYITALDKKTGKTLWKADRDEPSSWATPLVVEHDGKAQVIASGDNFARGYDLESGKELWRSAGQTGRPVASPVAGHGLAIIGSGFRGSFLGAFRLDGKGVLEETGGVAWDLKQNAPDIPSPLLSGRRLYFHSGRQGIISCYDAVEGKPIFPTQRVPGLGDVYASPVSAAGKVYMTGRDGTTVVIEDADEFRVVATSSVGERVDATPAIAGGELFIRGAKHLFCIAGS